MLSYGAPASVACCSSRWFSSYVFVQRRVVSWYTVKWLLDEFMNGSWLVAHRQEQSAGQGNLDWTGPRFFLGCVQWARSHGPRSMNHEPQPFTMNHGSSSIKPQASSIHHQASSIHRPSLERWRVVQCQHHVWEAQLCPAEKDAVGACTLWRPIGGTKAPGPFHATNGTAFKAVNPHATNSSLFCYCCFLLRDCKWPFCGWIISITWLVRRFLMIT